MLGRWGRGGWTAGDMAGLFVTVEKCVCVCVFWGGDPLRQSLDLNPAESLITLSAFRLCELPADRAGSLWEMW